MTRSRKVEAIRQSLQTIEVLFESLCDGPVASDPSQAVDLGKRRFRLWQWVDVLDTVNQWLEAQVIALDSDSRVHINYNGWAARWNEWLDSNSPRIQFFRTHTKQSVQAPMQSPVPMVLSPSTFSGEDQRTDISELILQSQEVLNATQVRIGQYHYLARVVERESQAFRLIQPQPVRGDSPIPTENSDMSEWSSLEEGVESSEASSCEWSSFSPAKLELMLRGTQLSVLADRVGRALSDLATLAERDEDMVRPMPPQVQLVDETASGELFIQIYHLPGGRRQ